MSEPEPGLQARSCLGQRATSPGGAALFAALNTLYRPELPEDEPWLTDTWDVDRYRLNVVYAADSEGTARLACRVMPAPIERKRGACWPRLAEVVDLLGEPIDSPAVTTPWGEVIDTKRRQTALEDGEIDLLATHGATIDFATDRAAGPGIRSVTLYRNRDRESAGWEGELPLGLVFDDSPETLFSENRPQTSPARRFSPDRLCRSGTGALDAARPLQQHRQAIIAHPASCPRTMGADPADGIKRINQRGANKKGAQLNPEGNQ